jgi:putative membrane fusion protein
MTKPIDFPQPENSQEERDDTSIKKGAAIKRITYGSLLLFLFMLLYIPSLLNWLSGNHITRDVIRNGIIESYIQTTAVIIRDEELLEPSEIIGRCIPEIPEGGRTAAYSRIAMIMNDTSGKLISDMEKINTKIVKARMEQAEKADFFSEDLNRLDDEIAHEIQDLIQACNSREFAKMARYRTNIGKIVEKKAEIVGVNTTDSYISSLLHEKEAIQQKINSNTVEVRSNISGIVSYVIDGYESILTMKSIENLRPADLDKIIEREAEGHTAGDKVQDGSPFAKIIKGTDIYIAATVPAKYATNYEKGAKIALRINSIGLETTGTITNVISSDGNQVIVVLQMSRGVDLLSASRVIHVDFINNTEEGLKVPLKSLWDVSADGTRGKIMLIKYNVATVREVTILCRDEEFAIISTPKEEYDKTVNLYDTYIMNPGQIMEGEIIEK